MTSPDSNRRPLGAAHAMVLVLGALLLAALLIGLTSGVISEKTLRPSPATPSDSITVP